LFDAEIICGENIIDAQGGSEVGVGSANAHTRLQKSILQVISLDGKIGVRIRNIIQIPG
jgi:hypothetical protein